MFKKIINLYHKILLLLGKTFIGNTHWYRQTIYEEAQWIIGNRPWKFRNKFLK